MLFCLGFVAIQARWEASAQWRREQAIQQLRTPEPAPEPEPIKAPHINSRAAKRVAVSPEHAKEREKVMEKSALWLEGWKVWRKEAGRNQRMKMGLDEDNKVRGEGQKRIRAKWAKGDGHLGCGCTDGS